MKRRIRIKLDTVLVFDDPAEFSIDPLASPRLADCLAFGLSRDGYGRIRAEQSAWTVVDLDASLTDPKRTNKPPKRGRKAEAKR